MNAWLNPLTALLVLVSALNSAVTIAADHDEDKAPPTPSEELHDRNVDSASMAVQETAIKKLEVQVRKLEGSAAEPNLLFRLATLQHRAAETDFRVSHGVANRSKKAVDLSRYYGWLKKEIATLTRLITQYPASKRVPDAYFMRAKAYRDIGEKDTALKELAAFASKYSSSPDAVLAHIYVAEMAYDAGDYKTAIERYQRGLAKSPDEGQYAFILDRLAQSHFNVGDFPHAMKYIEELALYDQKRVRAAEASGKPAKLTSVSNHLEVVLQSATYYYATAIDRKDPAYNLASAMEFFKRVTPKESRGRTFYNFALALRAKNLEPELVSWKNTLVREYADLPETARVLTCVYSAFTQWGRYPLLAGLARDLNTLYSKNKKVMTHFREDQGFVAFQAQLLETAERIQSTVPKEATFKHYQSISPSFTAVLNVYLQVAETKNPMTAKVRYRLAEHYYDAHDYDKATTSYSAIISSPAAAGRTAAISKDLIFKAMLRRISARYEILKGKKVIPEDLKAVAVKEDPKEINAPLVEWVKWIDEFAASKEALASDKKHEFEAFVFESTRALYHAGAHRVALARIENFLKMYPHSKSAQASAALIVDTYVASEKWDEVISGVERVQKVLTQSGSKLLSGAFGQRLTDLVRDAKFKIVEDLYTKKQMDDALAKALDYLKAYPKSPHTVAAYAVAGSAALAVGKKEEAREHYKTLVKLDPNTEHIGTALLLSATAKEEKLEFLGAAREYRELLAVAPSKRKLDDKTLFEVRTKVLLLSTLSGVKGELDRAIADDHVCKGKAWEECERYEAIQLLMSRSFAQASPSGWLKRAMKANPRNKILFVALALGSAQHSQDRMGPQDFSYSLERVIADWDGQDAIAKFTILPTLSTAIAGQFVMERNDIAQKIGLVNDPAKLQALIKQRIKAIEKFEAKATQVVKLPFVGIRASILSEVSGAYLDFANGLIKLKAPKMFSGEDKVIFTQGMNKVAMPYEEKGLEVLAKAYELTSKHGVEPKVSRRIFAQMRKYDPSRSQHLEPMHESLTERFARTEMLPELDPEGHWELPRKGVAPLKTDDMAKRIAQGWSSALYYQNWARVGYFVAKAGELQALSKGMLAAAKGVSFVRAGAAAEGIEELKQAALDLGPKARARVLVALVAHHFAAVGKDSTRDWTSRLIEPGTIKDEYITDHAETALVVGAAARWSGQYLPDSLMRQIQGKIAESDALSGSAWGKFVLDPVSAGPAEDRRPATGDKGGSHGSKK